MSKTEKNLILSFLSVQSANANLHCRLMKLFYNRLFTLTLTSQITVLTSKIKNTKLNI